MEIECLLIYYGLFLGRIQNLATCGPWNPSVQQLIGTFCQVSTETGSGGGGGWFLGTAAFNR